MLVFKSFSLFSIVWNLLCGITLYTCFSLQKSYAGGSQKYHSDDEDGVMVYVSDSDSDSDYELVPAGEWGLIGGVVACAAEAKDYSPEESDVVDATQEDRAKVDQILANPLSLHLEELMQSPLANPTTLGLDLISSSTTALPHERSLDLDWSDRNINIHMILDLGARTNLTELNINFANSNIGYADLVIFLEVIEQKTSLKHLGINFANSKINGTLLECFMIGLGNLASLVTLSINLNHSNINILGLEAFAKMTVKLTKLKKLSVFCSSNAQMSFEQIWMLTGLDQSLPHLECFDIYLKNLSTSLTDADKEELKNQLMKSKGFTTADWCSSQAIFAVKNLILKSSE